MSPKKDLTVRKAAYEWYVMSGVERVVRGYPLTYEEMAEKLNISADTLQNWEDDFYAGKYVPIKDKERNLTTMEQVASRETKKIRDRTRKNDKAAGEFETAEYLRKHSKQIADAIIMGCKAGNAQAMRLAKQLTGELVEQSKTEVVIGLSADEIARRNLEAERQLREGGYRMEKVQKEPPVLSE